MLQSRMSGGHGQRMPHKGAGKKCHPNFRVGFITETPHSSIQCIHESARPGDNTNRHATAKNFAVRGQIRAHAKILLSPTQRGAEPSNDFIENQSDIVLLCKLPKSTQELTRLAARMAGLHWLDQNTRDLSSISPDDIQGGRISI